MLREEQIAEHSVFRQISFAIHATGPFSATLAVLERSIPVDALSLIAHQSLCPPSLECIIPRYNRTSQVQEVRVGAFRLFPTLILTKNNLSVRLPWWRSDSCNEAPAEYPRVLPWRTSDSSLELDLIRDCVRGSNCSNRDDHSNHF